jgi:hypothetical protein
LAAPSIAQTRPSTTATPVASPAPSAATDATDNNDLSITANVTARELTFEVVPNPKVEFPGQPRRETVWDAVRTNLPPTVQPGVTYRDIGIRLKITSVFADIDRIVAEALGEIPVSDNAPPTNATDATNADTATNGDAQMVTPASSASEQKTSPRRSSRRTARRP